MRMFENRVLRRILGHNRIPKRILYMKLESTIPRGRPRNRWQDEVREDGRIVGGEGWQEKLYCREEWKKLLRTARNCHILVFKLSLCCANRILSSFG
jgi:hypothetical protein